MPAKLLYTYQFGQPWRPAPFDVPHGGSVVIESGCLKIYGPVERPAEPWTGDGLPPVGTECEIKHLGHAGGFHPAKITYHGRNLVAFQYQTGNPDQHEFADEPRNLIFRPARTPEQKARDEAVDAMLAIVGGSERRVVEQLFDAGYRKVTSERQDGRTP